MNSTQANANQLPAHVVAAVTSAAGIASRILARDYGVSISKGQLRAQGIELAHQQSALGGGKHPLPEHEAFVQEVMIVALTEHYAPAAQVPSSVRALTVAEERALLDRLSGREAH
ncbi:hypothetical protein [Paraburkholderia sp.]|uniref:hypothetical protein n=1 Tax=Paraburkholderia sp. TaxID=1926495 RepID=UPI0023844BEC|nr:hypothetical protein [Paraburkholderia sp.]MDE1183580.1 hypothetical protein [Paraburkholderia sp.]